MSKNTPRKRRRQDRKRKQREVAKRRARARNAVARSAAGRMRAAGRWDLFECRISEAWAENLFAQVLIARRRDARITTVLFLVDLGCLGVKDCVMFEDMDDAEYRAFLERLSERDSLEECSPALAVKVVEAGVAYASRLGFSPCRDYSKARGIFGDIDPGDCDEPVVCGKDGRPYYISGPSDDVSRVMRTLAARLGPDGFDFIAETEIADGEICDCGHVHEPLSLEETDDPEAPTAARLRVAKAALVAEVFEYALESYGEEYLRAAWDELWLRTDIPLDDERRDGGLWYASWTAFDWIPPANLRDRADPPWPAVPPVREFLDEFGDELSGFQRRFLEAGLRRPMSLYRVAGRREDHRELEDLLTAEVHRVVDADAAALAGDGDIILARVLPLDGEAIIVGVAPRSIPAGEPYDMDALRSRLAGAAGRLGEDDLRRFEREVRRHFLGEVGWPAGAPGSGRDGSPARGRRGDLGTPRPLSKQESRDRRAVLDRISAFFRSRVPD